MDIDKLERLIQSMTGESDVKAHMRTVAHWLKRIKAEKEYVTDNEREVASLKKLAELRLFEIELSKKSDGEEATVKLNKEGEELSNDFFRKGYYL